MLGRLLRFSAGIVHRSFRRFEHFADWLTGAAGPVFIVICWVLVGMGAWSYFTTMFAVLTPLPTSYAPLWDGRVSVLTLPLLSWNAIVNEPLLTLRFAATLSACLFIGYSVFFHYYMAITEPPGGVMTGLSPALHEHRLGTGSTRWWLDVRKRIARASPVSLRAHSDLVVVLSKPIKLLKANESSEWQARARQERHSHHASHPLPSSGPIPVPSSSQRSGGAAALVSPPTMVPTSSSSVPPSSSTQNQESPLPQSLPRHTYSLRLPPGGRASCTEPRRAATPDASLERDMYSAHATSLGSKGKQPDDLTGLSSRAGHRTESSLSSMPPRNGDVLIAPKPRAGAIHHMPTMPMNKGFQFPPGNGMAMTASNSHNGAPSLQGRFNSSPRSSIDTTSTTFLGGAGGQAGTGPLLEDIDSDDLFPVAKMCHKCPKVPLFKALAALPPELRCIERAIRSKHAWPPRPRTLSRQDSESEDEASLKEAEEVPGLLHGETEEDIRAWLGEEEAWQLVPPPKPERTHHCSVCKTCILKYDHHCPWLNQCVGLGNERYFVLFMAWLAIACVIISATGFPVARQAFHGSSDWPHPYTPRVCVLITWTLALIIGLGVGVMAAWQILLVARGETSVESHDNQHYDMLARRRGQRFQNVYDLGTKQNLRLFFNTPIDESSTYATAGGLHMRTNSTETLPADEPKDDFSHIFLPIRVAPYSDGWHWAKRRGLGGRHAGIESVEELTDDEEEYS